MIVEEWREIEDYPAYQVSNLGRVKRLAGKGCKKERILKKYPNNCGYLRVRLSQNGESKQFFVADLVANAFLGPRPDGLDINHIDGNKQNNAAANLEYCTRSENIRHAFSTGLRSDRGEKHPQSKLTQNQVIEIKQHLEISTKEFAQRFNVSYQAVWDIRAGRRWKHLAA